jgi:hypothetical protein
MSSLIILFIRDTALYPLLRQSLAAARGDYHPSKLPSLKSLCHHLLGLNIQGGEHCPIEDAASAMKLYKQFHRQWEASLRV